VTCDAADRADPGKQIEHQIAGTQHAVHLGEHIGQTVAKLGERTSIIRPVVTVTLPHVVRQRRDQDLDAVGRQGG
jgi:hypothetical protein